MLDDTVHVRDLFRIGSVVVEVAAGDVMDVRAGFYSHGAKVAEVSGEVSTEDLVDLQRSEMG